MCVDRITLCAAAEFADQRADLADLVGIEADRRFVEDDHIGLVHDGLRDADALLVALGQGADQLAADIGEAAALPCARRLRRARRALAARGAAARPGRRYSSTFSSRYSGGVSGR